MNYYYYYYYYYYLCIYASCYAPKLLLFTYGRAYVVVAGGAPANEKPFAVFSPSVLRGSACLRGAGRAGRWGGP